MYCSKSVGLNVRLLLVLADVLEGALNEEKVMAVASNYVSI